jgi:hypothetical protein
MNDPEHQLGCWLLAWLELHLRLAKVGWSFISKPSPKPLQKQLASPIISKIKLTYSRIVAWQLVFG